MPNRIASSAAALRSAPFFLAREPVGPPPHQVRVERNVRVPMRDGITLSTDMYVPMQDGKPLSEKLPAVMQRSAYNKLGLEPMASYFAGHGYLSVVQDSRGRGMSEGKWFAFANEAEDGFDTVEWLARQPLCNGRVGMYGCSYMGWTQLQAAALGPKGLATIIPFQGPINGYRYSMHPGGAMQLGLLRWALQSCAGSHAAKRDPTLLEGIPPMFEQKEFLQWAERVPWPRGQTPLSKLPEYEDSAFELFFEHPDYDQFWKRPGLAMDEHFDSFPDIPILWVGGWYDWYPRSLSDGCQALMRRNRKNQYLLMGPWVHNNFDRHAGQANFDAGSAGVYSQQEYLDLQLRWFDQWMRPSASSPSDSTSGASVFIMGGGDGGKSDDRINHGGRWEHFTAWPPTDSRPTPYYLRADGGLSPGMPSEQVSSSAYTHDPRNSVSSTARCYIPFGPPTQVVGPVMGGPHDQIQYQTLPGHGTPGLPIAARPDVLIFQTDPLAHDLEIAGNVLLHLEVSSDAPDTDFFVRLIDVHPPGPDYPGGFAFPLTDGVMRAGCRGGFERPTPMEPGTVYHLEIPLEPTANRFLAGHRIRVQICSSNFPAFAINRNTGDPFGQEWRLARNAVWHDAQHASCIMLPVR